MGMRHPFDELVPVIVSNHTWYEDRQGRAGCAIVGDPRIGFSAHRYGMTYYTCRQYVPWSFNGFNADFPWRAVPAVVRNDADLRRYQVYFPVELFKNADGSWMTVKDVHGRWRELRHKEIYDSFAEACMALIEDFHSGALEMKMQITSSKMMGEQHPIMKRALLAFEGKVAAN